MGKKLANLGFLVVVSFIFTQCANKGTASGGPKDEAASSDYKIDSREFFSKF